MGLSNSAGTQYGFHNHYYSTQVLYMYTVYVYMYYYNALALYIDIIDISDEYVTISERFRNV